MNCWQSGCFLAAVFSFLVSSHETRADELTEDNLPEPQQVVTPLTKDQYESEVMALETWKASARSSFMGKRLMGYLETLDASLVRNPRDARSLYNRGYLYGTVGCSRAAIFDLSKAIQVDPMSSSLYCERGTCYFDMGSYDSAMRDFNKAVELNPLSGDAHLARGRLLLWLNLPAKALPDLLAARDGEFSPALPGELPANFYHAPDYYLGTCYELLGNPDEALKHFKESSKEVTGAGTGFIHRYADQPVDAEEKASKLNNG